MKAKTMFIFIVLTIIGLGVFVLDWFLMGEMNTKSQVEAYPNSSFDFNVVQLPKNIIPIEKTLTSFINPDEKDISINEIKFYQDQYTVLPSLNCLDPNALKMKRSYIIDQTTYDKTEN